MPTFLDHFGVGETKVLLVPHPPPLMADGQPQAVIPPQPKARQLRACLLCSLIQTPGDFRKNGCPNCEEILQVCSRPLRIHPSRPTENVDERLSGPHSVVHFDVFRRDYRFD